MTNNFNFGLFASGRQSAYSRVSFKPEINNKIETKNELNKKPDILESPRSQRTNNKIWFG